MRILLVCAAGMSTSLLVNKMKEHADKLGIDVEIFALPISECSTVANDVDIVLLGPQVRYQKPQVESIIKEGVPIEVIDMKHYGTMNGEAVLNRALELVKK